MLYHDRQRIYFLETGLRRIHEDRDREWDCWPVELFDSFTRLTDVLQMARKRTLKARHHWKLARQERVDREYALKAFTRRYGARVKQEPGPDGSGHLLDQMTVFFEDAADFDTGSKAVENRGLRRLVNYHVDGATQALQNWLQALHNYQEAVVELDQIRDRVDLLAQRLSTSLSEKRKEEHGRLLGDHGLYGLPVGGT